MARKRRSTTETNPELPAAPAEIKEHQTSTPAPMWNVPDSSTVHPVLRMEQIALRHRASGAVLVTAGVLDQWTSQWWIVDPMNLNRYGIASEEYDVIGTRPLDCYP